MQTEQLNSTGGFYYKAKILFPTPPQSYFTKQLPYITLDYFLNSYYYILN